MSTEIKPIKLWDSQGPGPNPSRVKIILEELGIPYESNPVAYANVKDAEFVAVNPNGRLPAIHDPNTDLTLWESAAIVLYLVDKYDRDHKLSFPAGSNEAHLAQQWMLFQASGQGPYYGQAVWFTKFHPEQLPSAKERYVKEINRVTGVLDAWLAKQEVVEGNDGPWLVGGRLSVSDLAFVPWQLAVATYYKGSGFEMKEYPHANAWLNRMAARESVKKAIPPMPQ